MPPSPLPSPSEPHAADGDPRRLPAPSDDPAAGPQCVRVGVVPAAAATAHARLLAALEAVYPVRFEPRAAGDWRELDAVVAFGALATGPPPLPLLRAAAAESPAGAPQPLRLADDPRLERPLRGVLLHDAHGAGLPAA